MPNRFSPIYRAQPLKPRDYKRINRNALPPVDRAALWPVDRFELERQQRRELLLLDCALGVVWGLIALCIVGVIVGL